MHDTIVAGEIVEGDVADILVQIAIRGNDALPRAAVEQAEIATGDGMAGLLEQIHEMDADIAFMASDKNFHGLSLNSNFVMAVENLELWDTPRGLAGFPKFVEVFAVALGIHRVPKAAMLADAQLAIARQLHKRFPL